MLGPIKAIGRLVPVKRNVLSTGNKLLIGMSLVLVALIVCLVVLL